MKIVRNTPDQLILRSAPWVLAVLLGGFILGSIGFGLNAFFAGGRGETFWGLIGIPGFLAIFLVIFVRRDDLILDRSRDLLELRHSTFLGRRKVRHALHNLDRAIVQTSNSGDGGPTHRIALVLTGGMDAGTHPVTPVYASGRGAARGVAAINEWLSRAVDSDRRQA